MMSQENTLPEPPKTLKSIRIGFDAITQHIGLILFPLALDLVIWFAPHLRIKRQMERVFAGFTGWQTDGYPQAEEWLSQGQMVREFVTERINLVVALRSYPVGIFSLLSSVFPLKTPVGDPLFVEVMQPGLILSVVLAFLLLGIVIGSFYYAGVNQAALYDEVRWADVLKRWPWLIKHTLLLGLIWLGLFFVVSILGGCVMTGLMFINPGLIQTGSLLVGLAYVWLLFPLFFSPHGIFVEKKTAWRSVYDSVRMTNLSFLQTGFFILLAILITQGLDLVWQVSPEDSWLMLISIAGHAFVSTGVLAASFVYYQDLSRWIQEIMAWRDGELSRKG